MSTPELFKRRSDCIRPGKPLIDEARVETMITGLRVATKKLQAVVQGP